MDDELLQGGTVARVGSSKGIPLDTGETDIKKQIGKTNEATVLEKTQARGRAH